MRILMHDYGGFPYPWQLARTLADRGHNVEYIYNAAEPPRATIQTTPEERGRLTALGIKLPKPLLKRSFVKRRAWEVQYGRTVGPEIDRFRPDVVISANTPLDTQVSLLRHTRRQGARFVFWVQDLNSVAAYAILKERLSLLGALVGKHYIRLERSLLRQSDEVVLITEDFRSYMDRWGVPREKTHVVENWAPIEQLPMLPRHNAWAKQHDLQDKICLLYAGTLGLKHNPELLARLAQTLQCDPRIQIVAAAEGSGIPLLKQMKEEMHLDNLRIMPFQPFDTLPMVMASADLLIAILEPSGSQYCVPSKVLTYLCSGRPLLLAVTPDNLTARIVERNQAGLVVSPTDADAFVKAAERLLHDRELRVRCGRNARSYAEAHFNIDVIADRFEMLISQPGLCVTQPLSRVESVR